MEGLLLLLFIIAIYSLAGYISREPFRAWCKILFKTDHELTQAIGLILAVFWPIGWPVIVVVGLYYAGYMLAELLVMNLLIIWDSCKVISDRFKQVLKSQERKKNEARRTQ